MTNLASKLTLCMIVRDEANIVSRCLNSVRDHVDYWVIADTGSTDDTRNVILKNLSDVPGQLIDIPWKNFSDARNSVLKIASQQPGYCLTIDADEVLNFENGSNQLPVLSADSYLIKTDLCGIEYWRRQIFHTRKNWYYVGDLHEYLTCDDSFTEKYLQNVTNIAHQDSARNQDSLKYEKDIRALEQMLSKSPGDSRILFNIALTHETAGSVEAAIGAHLEHIESNGEKEHVWYSWYQLGLLYERSNNSIAEIIECYEKAFEILPDRSEPLVRIIKFLIDQGDWISAKDLMGLVDQIPYPEFGFFVQRDVYKKELPQIKQYLMDR